MSTVVSKSYAPIRGRYIRVTRLDDCGVPVVGSASSYVSKGFISVATKFSWSKPTDVSVSNADQTVAINEPGLSQLLSIGLDIKLSKVNPDLMSIFTGYSTVLDASGASVGYRASSGVQLKACWALEIWSDVAGTFCGGGAKPYGYTLFPFIRGGSLSDFTVDSGAASLGISASTREGAGWGTGPYFVVDASTTPGTVTPAVLATAMDVREQMHTQLTTLAPPAETNGVAAITSLTPGA